METPSRYTFSPDGSTNVFQIPVLMKGDNYVRIDINDITVNDRNKFDIVNNSIVFVSTTDVPAGSKLDILVVQTDEGIPNLGNVNSIDIVSQNITSVNTVATDIAAVVNNSNNMAAIQAVDANMPAVVNAVQAATDAAASETAAAASETAAAASEVAAASSETLSTLAKNAAEASAVSAATSYDDFQDIYLGSKTTEPTVDNDGDPLATGALYFDSLKRGMRVWDGISWVSASTVGGASLTNFNFTAVDGQTTFSGLDDNSSPLAYTVKSIIVTLNGVALKEGIDYTANDALSVVLTTGAAAGDDLHVVAFKSFSADELITGANGGTFTADVSFGDNDKVIFGAGSDLEIRADSLGAHITSTPSLEISSYDIITIGGNNSILPNMIVDSASGTAFLDSLGSPVANIPNNSLGTAQLNIDLDVTGDISASGTLTAANISDGTDTVAAGYVVNGSAKAWVNFAGVADTVLDSLNLTSITDNGTADYTLAWTSSFGNVNYSHAGMSGAAATEMVVVNQPYGLSAPTTNASRYTTTVANGTLFETGRVNISVHGDLA